MIVSSLLKLIHLLAFSALVYILSFAEVSCPKHKSSYVTTLIKNIQGCPCISACIKSSFQVWHIHPLSLLFHFNLDLQIIFHDFPPLSSAHHTTSSSRLCCASSGLLAFTRVLSCVQCLLLYPLPFLDPPDRS